MSAFQTPFAISGIKEAQKIRVLIYANNEIAHAPLNAVLKAGITSSSNENGNFTRFADGTQICWANTVESLKKNNDPAFYEWTFPATFVSIPVVTITPFGGQVGTSIMISLLDVDKVQLNSNGTDIVSNPLCLQRMAVGRWF